MERIYICSRFKSNNGDTEKYTQLARIYCRMAWDRGYFPIAPQLYLPQVLDYGNKTERDAALKIYLKVVPRCSELWVFGIAISKSMQAVIDKAKELKIPVRYFDEYGEPL